MIEKYTEEAVELLKRLIATPSVSRDESRAADVMEKAMRSYGYSPERIGNNLMIKSAEWDDSKPTILLNAHIDTVKPVSSWTKDPFSPTLEGDRLYGLGSNDCGGGLVSLLQVFRILDSPLPPLLKRGEQCAPTTEGDSSSIAVNLSQRGEQCAPTNEGNSSSIAVNLSQRGEQCALTNEGDSSSIAVNLSQRGEQCAPTNEGDSSSIAVNLSQRGEQCAPTNEGDSSPLSKRGAGGESNLIFLASAEEEVSGAGGIRAVLPLLPRIDVAIVGEPTGMQPAVAERGLMVIDAVAHGKSGHAARNEGVNAIYEALDDLVFIRDYRFERVSPLLGPTKMQCTIVNSGTQHNVVPDECRFTIDVRTNELYTNEEVFEFLQTKLKSELKARSFHLHSSSLYNGNDNANGLREAPEHPKERKNARKDDLKALSEVAPAGNSKGLGSIKRVSEASGNFNGNFNGNGNDNGLRACSPVIGREATLAEQEHPLERKNLIVDGFREKFSELGLEPFGSPTLSDQALMRFPSFKLGPGESSRSHSADEFICVSEIRKAIETYLRLLAF